MKRVALTALALAAIALVPRPASPLGLTTGTNSALNKQHGPNIYRPPFIDGAGNEWWVMTWSICPQFVCAALVTDNGFHTLPGPFAGGSDRLHNGAAIGVTLPPFAVVQAMTMRHHSDVVHPTNNVGLWLTTYPPTGVSAGMYFQPAFPKEMSQITSASFQGPGAQAFELWTPLLAGFSISPDEFDVIALVETPPGVTQAQIQDPYGPSGTETGTVGLYSIDFASNSQSIAVVHPDSDPGDPCTLGATQILPFDLRDCVLAGAQQPGTPNAGPNFSVVLRENFVYPPFTHAVAGAEPAVSVPLPVPVQPGFVVLVDNTAQPAIDSRNWSDIIRFSGPTPATPGVAQMISGPVERAFTDADLAQYGFSMNDVLTGNTVFVPERQLFTLYQAVDPSTNIVARYRIYSDVDTLPPGSPLVDVDHLYQLIEPPGDASEPSFHLDLGEPVQPGFVVLLEDTTDTVDPENPANWSDVLYFHTLASAQISAVDLISDKEAAGTPGGISDADLAQYNLTALDVIDGNTLFLHERLVNLYDAVNPYLGGRMNHFVIVSDPEAAGVPRTGEAARLAIRAVAPNPARGATTVELSLPTSGHARLEIYDLGGRRVRTLLDGEQPAGPQSVRWDGRDQAGHVMAAGAYIARLTATTGVVSRRVVLIR